MGENDQRAGSLSRRSFLKAGGVATVLAASGMATSQGWLAPASASADETDSGQEKTAYLCHQFHCLGGCGLKATVRDGRLVKIEPREMEDGRYSKICLRGINEVQHVYANDRLQTPLKRVGERGEGKFVEVSWDEAVKTIADNLKDCISKYGDGSVYIKKSVEANSAQGFSFLEALIKADNGGAWSGLDRGIANGLEPALQTVNANSVNSIWEWRDAKTIINLGNNICESGIIWSQAMVDAQDAGAKVITIDPRFSTTAAKSDQWISVKPGQDGALVLGMVNLVLDQGLYDEPFIIEHTSFPFLVDAEDGTLLGETSEDTTRNGTDGTVVHPLVWDTKTKTAVPYDTEDIEVALEGTFTVDGRPVVTEFTLLKEKMAPYTLDWASETSGVDSDTITNLVDDYVRRGNAIINYGIGGPDKYANADVLGHAIAILVALTGNYGRSGAGAGFYNSGGGSISGALSAWKLPDWAKVTPTTVQLYDMPFKENKIHAALTFGDAFTLRTANSNATLDWVKGLDFFAMVDIYHSSACDYADIILPATTKFESDEDYKNLRISQNRVFLAQKCIDPLFSAKSDLEIERLLAAQWGYENLLPKTYEELSRAQLDGVEGALEGITFDELVAHDCMMPLKGADDPESVGYHTPEIKTPTGRLELYYEDLVDEDQAFPTFENPNEAYDSNDMKSTYPLIFMQGKTRYRIHAYYSASDWFRQFYEPTVNMNPIDAQSRNIESGDDVRVKNDRGEFVCKAILDEGLPPGVLFMAETTYKKYYKEGFLQNVTNSYRQERCRKMKFGPQIPYNDVLVEVEKA